MGPELRQVLRVDDPMEEPELNLDGLPISSIQVLLEPPMTIDEDDEFWSPLDHFQNLVKLSMTSAQCQALAGFPHLPKLRSLLLADNDISEGLEALVDANLQNLVVLDLTANKITDVQILAPLIGLEHLQHLNLAECDVASQGDYRSKVFEVLPQLITVDGQDRDGTEIDVMDDEAVSSVDGRELYDDDNVEDDEAGQEDYDDEENENTADLRTGDSEASDGEERFNEDTYARSHDQHQVGSDVSDDENEDEDEDVNQDVESDLQGSGSEGEEDQEDMAMDHRTAGSSHHAGHDDVDDELEDEDEDDEEDADIDAEHVASDVHHVGSEDEEDIEDEEEDEERDEEDEEEDDEEEEGPGLAYLLEDDIQDENDEEFEPTNEAEEESELESSDEDEYGSGNAASSSGSKPGGNTNGHHPKRPRSPTDEGVAAFDHGAVEAVVTSGFDVDGDDSNGFGMAAFDGPATFDEETGHESKRART